MKMAESPRRSFNVTRPRPKHARFKLAFPAGCSRALALDMLEAAAEVEPTTGSVVHAFTTGKMVQVFLLTKNIPTPVWNGNELSPQS